jgi:DNA topoisomerase-3
MSYVCEKSVGLARSCDFRSGKVILQQPVERAQMAKLLSEGRTDLLDGFVSSRTRRRFKAFLVRQPDGKVGFEFQAAGPRAGARTAAKGADADAPVAPAPVQALKPAKSAKAPATAVKAGAKKPAAGASAATKAPAKSGASAVRTRARKVG